MLIWARYLYGQGGDVGRVLSYGQGVDLGRLFILQGVDVGKFLF